MSLIELIAVIVILGVAMPPMMLSLGEGQRRRASPLLADIARWLVSERVEQLLADRYSPSRGFAWLVPGSYPDEATVDGFDGFARSVRFETRGRDLSPGDTGVLLAVVEVSWLDPARGARSTSVSFAFAEPEP